VGNLELKSAVFRALAPGFDSCGFVQHKSKEWFIKSNQHAIEMFLVTCLDAKPGIRITPSVAIRINRVEELFHKISRFETKYQKDTPTMGTTLRELLDADTEFDFRFVVSIAADVPRVVPQLLQLFREHALPYYEGFSSVQVIDWELNSNPTERTMHCGGLPFFRCSKGMIVAKLVGRQNYDELAAIYSDRMSKVQNGFYFQQFQDLLKLLQEVKPESKDVSPPRLA
jgi:hypothetical protein